MANIYPLKELCSNEITDGTHKTPTYSDSGYIFLSSKNVTTEKIDWKNVSYIPETLHNELYNRLSPQKDDILLAKNGTTGVAAIVDRDEIFDIYVSLALVRPDPDKVVPRYLLYAINSDTSKRYFNSHLKGIGVPNLHLTHIRETPIRLPSKNEQQHIVEILDKLTDLLSLRRQQLVKLDELVKARFVEMFGIPGTNPKGWDIKHLGDCCKLNPKKSCDERLKNGLLLSFVPMPAVSEDGKIDGTDIRKYDEVKTGFTYFAENDVLFAKITPCMENGKGAIAQGLRNGIGFGSTEFHVLRPVAGKSNPYWLYILTSFSSFRKDAAKNMTGSAGQRRVPASYLESFNVFCPPIDLQEDFALFAKKVNRQKLTIQQSLDKLELLKKSLMQEYFE